MRKITVELTPEQVRALSKLADEAADQYLDLSSELDDALFEASVFGDSGDNTD